MTFVNEIDEKTTHVVIKSLGTCLKNKSNANEKLIAFRIDKNRELVDCCDDYLLGILHGCSIVQSACKLLVIYPMKRY